MTKSNYLVTELTIKGTLVEILIKKESQVKYLKLVTEQQEYWIKLAKEIRENFAQRISLGANVIVEAIQKRNIETGKVKYKAHRVQLTSTSNDNIIIPNFFSASPQNKAKSKAKVLVCKKSSCWKKGGKAVCQILEDMRRDRDLEKQIEVKTTGCLKQCKKGPNVVMMPDKARYSKVKPKQITALVEKHLLVN